MANEDNVCVVVAAGNRDRSSEREGVACPALPDSVISVGGYRPMCTKDIIRDGDSGQWWVDGDVTYGPYCGQQGCYPGYSCDNNRQETEWGGNVSFHNDVPDIMAPVVEVHGPSLDKVTRQSGTSFGAPLVSGLTALMLGELADNEISPSSKVVRRAIRYNAAEIDDSDLCKLDMKATMDYLFDVYSQS